MTETATTRRQTGQQQCYYSLQCAIDELQEFKCDHDEPDILFPDRAATERAYIELDLLHARDGIALPNPPDGQRAIVCAEDTPENQAAWTEFLYEVEQEMNWIQEHPNPLRGHCYKCGRTGWSAPTATANPTLILEPVFRPGPGWVTQCQNECA